MFHPKTQRVKILSTISLLKAFIFSQLTNIRLNLCTNQST
nr:MAG TPA: hypothetical protein [Caudoviricetes sp.]